MRNITAAKFLAIAVSLKNEHGEALVIRDRNIVTLEVRGLEPQTYRLVDVVA